MILAYLKLRMGEYWDFSLGGDLFGRSREILTEF